MRESKLHRWINLCLQPNSFAPSTPVRVLILIVLTGILVVTPVLPAKAATVSVNTFDDELNNDGDCSLREAIQAANTDTAVDACSAGAAHDDILLQAGTYVLSLTGGSDDANLTGDLDISSSIRLVGDLAGTTIDGGQIDRVLHVLSGASLEIDDLTITNGLAPVGAPGQSGGGILNEGSLTLFRSTISNNQAGNGAAGADGEPTTTCQGSRGGNGYQGGSGGGIASAGSFVHVINSTISGNDAGQGGKGGSGGAGYGAFCGGSGGDGGDGGNGGDGGGIHRISGSVAISNSTISNNTAGAGGQRGFGGPGAESNGSDGRIGSGGKGGGLSGQASVQMDSVILAGNTSSGTGPDCIAVTSFGYNIVGDTGGCTITAATGDQLNVDPLIGPLQDNGGATQTHKPQTGGPADGAIPPASCGVSDDQRGVHRPQGGNCEVGSVELLVPVVTNTADSGSGSLRDAVAQANALPGPHTITFDPSLDGQTIRLTTGQLDITDDLTINGDTDGDLKANVTVSGNDSSRVFKIAVSVTARLESLIVTEGFVSGEKGGAILNDGDLTVIHSTIRDSENSADSNKGGGGISNSGTGTLTIIGSTIRDNRSNVGGGAILNEGSVTITNSTITGNSGPGGGGMRMQVISSSFPVTTDISDSTITQNAATNGVGGGIDVIDGALQLRGSILAGNTATIAGPDCRTFLGTATSLGYNIVGNTSNCGVYAAAGDQFNVSASLAPLADNGGPTETHMPMASSLAVDVIPSIACNDIAGDPVIDDQRGIARPQSLLCDVGSVEIVPNPIPSISSISPDSATEGGSNFTLTVDGSDFVASSVVRWNGSDRTTSFISDTELQATIPSTDIAHAGSTFIVVQVTVFNPPAGGGLSNALPFTVEGPDVQSSVSQNVADGESLDVSVLPDESGEAGATVSLDNHTGGGGQVNVTVATYGDNPTSDNIFDVGGGYVDVRVDGADAADVADVKFYYPSDVTGLPEDLLQLMYHDGTGWALVRSSGDTDPVKNTDDNLDGTVSGGRFSVSFDETSTPKITELGGTVFTATVEDTEAPDLTLPADLEVEGNTIGGYSGDIGTATCTDLLDPSPTIDNDAEFPLPVGHTDVTWTCTDGSGNQDQGVQKVTVVDSTNPTVSPPADVELEGNSPGGYTGGIGSATCTDIVDEVPVVSNDAPSLFPLGETIVTWSCVDASGNRDDAEQTVTVVDTTKPGLTPPGNFTLQGNTSGGYIGSIGAASCHDLVDISPSVDNDAPSLLPLGVTEVTWTCTDASGNEAEATQTLTVVDITPPLVSVTGVEDGATYLLGAVPTAGCATSDAVSGVATPASLTVSGGNSDGSGVLTATCDGAVDNAGNLGEPAIATYTVITPQDAIYHVQGEIQDLVAAGVLKVGQANGLLQPLDNAVRSLDKGKMDSACSQLQDFIDEVNAKTPVPLDSASAASLIAGATAVQVAIGCE